VTEQSAERRPIGWWLKTADARIEHAFEDVFESQSITRREWQVLEPVSRAPVPEPELLQKLGAQDAVDELRRRGVVPQGVASGTWSTSVEFASRSPCATDSTGPSSR